MFGRWMICGRVTPGVRVGDEVTFRGPRWLILDLYPSTIRWYSRPRARGAVGPAAAERWMIFGRWMIFERWMIFGRWMIWALDDSRQGRPRVPAEKGVGSLSRRRFRAALATTPPLDLAAAPHLAVGPYLAAAAPKRGGTRPPSRPPPLKTPGRSQRGPSTAYIVRYRGAEGKFLGVGCSILGVGCLTLGVGCFQNMALGEHGPPFGRWMIFGRWMALDSVGWALDGVGEATARGDHEPPGPP